MKASDKSDRNLSVKEKKKYRIESEKATIDKLKEDYLEYFRHLETINNDPKAQEEEFTTYSPDKRTQHLSNSGSRYLDSGLTNSSSGRQITSVYRDLSLI